MTYIENVFFCLAAPLVVAVFCADWRRRRPLSFIVSGMLACLFSSYISTFLVLFYQVDAQRAAVEITPAVEEIMKLLPLLFYLCVFDPQGKVTASESLMVAVGFATLENACYLIVNGAGNVFHLLIRGFSTGAMHVACGTITGVGLSDLWEGLPLRVAAGLGALCMAFTWHAIYNILVSQTGAVAVVGYALPILTGAATILVQRRILSRNIKQP